ncbi:MAG TPA: endonuclease/exonuclease/phosphatase family protein, partial [Mariprofundaceae bacterium]|nr:endonuclease/exonuclease/phosphatase family protein [Mariprofundaceae bacterium]
MLVLGMLMAYPYLHQFIPSQVGVSSKHLPYKVMTYSKMGRNHDIGAVARVVSREKPDILFMQEISKTESQKLVQLLSAIYASPLFVDDHYGLILSRFRVVSRLKRVEGSHAADILLPEGKIRVWNVHLQKSISSRDLQYKSVNQLAEQIGQESGPVLVAGDFNATVLNSPYVKIRSLLDNAFEKVGFGFGFTFPSPARRMGALTPFMRIDHIFYSKDFTAHQAYVVHDAGGSDHYPVVALLSLT